MNSAPALLTRWPSSSRFACSAAPRTAQARLTAPRACKRTGCPTSPEGVDPAEFALSAAFTRATLVPSNACTSTSKSDTGATLPDRTPTGNGNPAVPPRKRIVVYPSNVLKRVHGNKSPVDCHVKQRGLNLKQRRGHRFRVIRVSIGIVAGAWQLPPVDPFPFERHCPCCFPL